ncbi:hypothetical protein FACS1894105_02800 [Clostridia bacterium]|nr:hypothetical protein FACS1894105_02800 [Clostridia bacterium]
MPITIDLLWIILLGTGSAVGVINGVLTLIANVRRAKSDNPNEVRLKALETIIENRTTRSLPDIGDLISTTDRNCESLKRAFAAIEIMQNYDKLSKKIIHSLICHALRGNHETQLREGEDNIVAFDL